MILYVGRLQTDILMLVDNNGRIGVPAEEGHASSCWYLNAHRHAFQFLLRSKDGAGAPFRTETPQSS